ncbi:MAG: OmpA family protein [Archangiaceae bacterium]|nr:OmpA family protein [Archangiaceae bacterium]
MSARLAVAAVLVAGCVTTGTHRAKVDELTGRLEAQAREAQERDRAAAARAAELDAALQLARGEVVQRQGALEALTAEREGLRKQLDDQTALVGELKKRLEKLGQNVDRLMSEKGALATSLDESKARLEELRKQREAAEQRLSMFKRLVEKFQSMIDAGQLKVAVRNGRMLLSLPDAVLFDSGRTELKPSGSTALARVAEVLGALGDRNFLVAGHTDDVPIHTARFPSNWDLSTARAVEVVNYLVSKGMRPQVLAAAGYGEFDPVAANDAPEHRAQNRRIEIVLQPNLAELPSLEGLSVKQ